jgi:hypothetical protein
MRIELDLNDLTDAQQTRMCDLCKDCLFDGSVNTNQYNLCEGSRCEDAIEYLQDELEIERYEKLRYLLIAKLG